MSEPLPDHVDALIAEHIHSVEQLLVLLVVRRRTSGVTLEEVMRDVRTSRHSIAIRLSDLVARGFVAADDESFRYVPDGADRDAAVDELARLYQTRRSSLIHAIFADR